MRRNISKLPTPCPQTGKFPDLNAYEEEVLASLVGAAMDASMGDFGIIEEAYHTPASFRKPSHWLSPNQFGGYVSQLAQKGYIHHAGKGETQYTLGKATREFMGLDG